MNRVSEAVKTMNFTKQNAYKKHFAFFFECVFAFVNNCISTLSELIKAILFLLGKSIAFLLALLIYLSVKTIAAAKSIPFLMKKDPLCI
ncbi:MAG: hypothetical protein LBV66_01480 [Elusimicrobiota bacterium]|jgi:hypothetical protein|nr:hypothetical protein [Elusimicrobiota bacterium]